MLRYKNAFKEKQKKKRQKSEKLRTPQFLLRTFSAQIIYQANQQAFFRSARLVFISRRIVVENVPDSYSG